MTNTPEGSAMSELVYQLKMSNGSWIDQELVSYEYNLKHGHEVRTLYPASAYEALQEKLDRLNGLYHSEVSKHQLDYNALKAENKALRKQVAELKTETAKDHVKIMHLKDALSAYGDPDVFADDED